MIDLPEYVRKICDLLYKNGFEAFIVGGCVRDSLMDKKPKDWDVTTNALPVQVQKWFESSGFKVIPTGIRHGTVTVVIEGAFVEITTYRIESNYSDNRRPDSVKFTGDLEQDLKRRDFTINAMAYNPLYGLVDIFGGVDDLNKRIIRCVGNADEKFEQDALRMIRAVRFCCELDFGMHLSVFNSIISKRHLIDNISRERIRDELNLILASKNADKGIEYMDWCGLCSQVLNVDICTCALKYVDPGSKNLTVRLAAAFHQSDCKVVYNLLKSLRYDNNMIKRVCGIINALNMNLDADRAYIKRRLNEFGSDCFLDFLAVKRACIYAGAKFGLKYNLDVLNKVCDITEDILNNNECFTLEQLKINGHDIIAMGVAPGPQVGRILKELLEVVIDHPELNQKHELIKLASNYIV